MPSVLQRVAVSSSVLASRPVQQIFAKQVVSRIAGWRIFSTAALPSNLKLADSTILDPVVEPEISVEQFSFPLLDVPESIVMKSFLNPGQVAGPIRLERKIFEVAIRKDIILQAIRYTRNKLRQPKKTKRMSEIRGSNKKPRPQKGTGQSQVGHRRNSAWRGGQKAHGPVLRDYSIGLNKKVRALAMMMSVAAKFREGNLYVFDTLTPLTHRTKELSSLLAGHGLNDSLVLFVDYPVEEALELSMGNMPKAVAMKLEHLNTYEVVKKHKLVFSQRAFEALQQQLLRQYTSKGKRGAMQDSMAEYLKIVEQGKVLMAGQDAPTAATA